MRLEEVGRGLGGGGLGYSGGLLGSPGGFEEHVKRLRGTMFYVCQVACLHRYYYYLILFRVPASVVLSATEER